MLSLKERLTLQKTVKSGIEQLKTGISNIRERLAVQKQILEALNTLKGNSSRPEKSLLERFLGGEFTNNSPQKFRSVITQIWDEVKTNLELLHKPLMAFFEAHKAEMVLEGAFMGIFESLSATDHSMPVGCGPGKSSGAVRIAPVSTEYGAPHHITIDIDTDFDSPETFRDIIRSIEQAREVDTIELKVNSHGGRTDSAQAIYVALLETKAKTIAKVITAYSSGSIVTMACDEIRTTPHCTMMIHNASAGTWGKIGEMKAQSNFMERHFKLWFEELYAGFLSQEEIEDVFKGQDIWLREEDIKKRLPKWKPIRIRRAAEIM